MPSVGHITCLIAGHVAANQTGRTDPLLHNLPTGEPGKCLRGMARVIVRLRVAGSVCALAVAAVGSSVLVFLLGHSGRNFP